MFTLAREYGAAVICLLIDEEGQARDVEWKMRIAHRIHDLAVNRYGLESGDLIFDALTFPLSTGDDDLRRDGIATIEAIRRIKAELPGVYTTLGVSQRELRPLPRRPPRAQQRVPARVRRGRPRLGHRPRGQDHAAATASPTSSARSASTSSGTAAAPRAADHGDASYDPLQKLLEVFADVKVAERREGGPLRLAGRAAPRAQRIIDGDRDGLDADLDEALAGGIARARRSSTTCCSRA